LSTVSAIAVSHTFDHGSGDEAKTAIDSRLKILSPIGLSSRASSKSSATRMSSASTVHARITIPDTVGRMEPAARMEGAIGGVQTVASGSHRP